MRPGGCGMLAIADSARLRLVPAPTGDRAEKRAAMKFWARQLSAILKGKSGTIVGRFKMTMG